MYKLDIRYKNASTSYGVAEVEGATWELLLTNLLTECGNGSTITSVALYALSDNVDPRTLLEDKGLNYDHLDLLEAIGVDLERLAKEAQLSGWVEVPLYELVQDHLDNNY